MKKITIRFMGGRLLLLLLTGCSGTGPSRQGEDNTLARQEPDCQIITQNEAIREGEHQVFELGYVTVEAVEVGYNPYHDVLSRNRYCDIQTSRHFID